MRRATPPGARQINYRTNALLGVRFSSETAGAPEDPAAGERLYRANAARRSGRFPFAMRSRLLMRVRPDLKAPFACTDDLGLEVIARSKPYVHNAWWTRFVKLSI